jgi:hypothetical protein
MTVTTPLTPTMTALGLFDRIAEFLRSVTPQDVTDLIEGRAWIAIGRPGGTGAAKPKRRALVAAPAEAADVRRFDEVIQNLKSAESTDHGIAYLEGLDLRKDDLKGILQSLRQRGFSKDNMNQLRLRIVRSTVGAHLQSEALRGL